MTPKQMGFYPRVALGFSRKLDPDLVAFSRNIVTLMTGNTNYATPSPTLATVTAAVDLFDQSIQDALNGGKLLIGARKANREALLSVLRDLAAYVTSQCQNDVLILQGSGFEGIKTPSPVGVLTAPQNPRLAYTGMSGELLLRFEGDRNARNYSIECALSPEGPWEDRGLSTSTRVMLNSLIPGKNYWARSSANGAAGPSEWSVPTTIMAV